MKRDKSILISNDLFTKMLFYFLFDDFQYHDEIKQNLEEKLDKLIKHEMYSKYKDKSLSDEEREQARKKYLDMIGMHNSFRW